MEKLLLFFISGIGAKEVETFLMSQNRHGKINEVVPGGEIKEKGVLIEIYAKEEEVEAVKHIFKALKGANVEFIGELGEELRK